MGSVALVVLAAALLSAWGAARARGAFHVAWARALALPAPAGLEAVQTGEQLLAGLGWGRLGVGDRPGTGEYRPSERTVFLSSALLATDSLASLAVVVHEVGHASQQRNWARLLQANQSLQSIAPVAGAVGCVLAVTGTVESSPLGLLLGAITVEVAFILSGVVCALERDASARGLALLVGQVTIDSADLGVLRSLLNAAARAYLALPFRALTVLGAIVLSRFDTAEVSVDNDNPPRR